MLNSNRSSISSFLLLAALLGINAAPLRAQQTTRQPQQPAQKFSGSIFGGPEGAKTKGGEKSKAGVDAEKPKADAPKDAAPAPSPIPYMTVAVKLTPREGDAAPQSSSSPPPPAASPSSPSSPQTTQQPAPSANNPQQTSPPAQSPQTSSPTQTQTQQSTNPAAPAQDAQPAQPTVPPTAPANPAPSPAQSQQQPAQTPTQDVQPPPPPAAPGRESVPAPAPQDTQLNVPQVAPDFRAEAAPFPTLERVGVDMGEQRALSVREAIELALANNKDIEVARENVRAAEFDLKAARGVYDPHFLTNSYYERTETPTASFLSGSSTGAVTQSGFFSTSSVQGQTPAFGGGYRLDFVNNRITTNNQFAALNPQYPSSLTFNYTQPIFRGRDFDQSRRQIEIAKKNLSLTDAQFRQRAIETITNVQRAYWDLVYALRNLKIQQDAVRDARAQLEHNKRLGSHHLNRREHALGDEALVVFELRARIAHGDRKSTRLNSSH